MTEREFIDGVLRKFWDDTTRTYTEYNAQGVQTVSRPYTPEENAQADAAAAAAAVAAADEAIRTAVKALRTELLAEKDKIQLVIDATTGNAKNTAQVVKRALDGIIDLAKLVDGRV